jgi:26S proteasome regulatory subunit N1
LVNHRLDLEEGPAAVSDDSEREALREIISNSKLSEHFLALAR